jgi:hypothetical protein
MSYQDIETNLSMRCKASFRINFSEVLFLVLQGKSTKRNEPIFKMMRHVCFASRRDTLVLSTFRRKKMSLNDSKTPTQPGADAFTEKEVLPGVFLTDYRAVEPVAIPFDSPLLAALDGVDFTEVEDTGDSSAVPRERKLADGIYMTDFRDTNTIAQHQHLTRFGAPVHGVSSQYDHPEIADVRVNELLNSIQHLERSNQELEEMKETDPDPIWQETIDENLGVIARQKAEIQRIMEAQPIHMTRPK